MLEDAKVPFEDISEELPITEEEQGQLEADDEESPRWVESKLRPKAVSITRDMQRRGYLIFGDDARPYYFDSEAHQLILLDEGQAELRHLLWDWYHINPKETVFSYTVEHLVNVARSQGRPVRARRFSYYDRDSNAVYLDMGNGKMLLITAHSVTPIDNGDQGVVFLPLLDHAPWEYRRNAERGLLRKVLVDPVNFTEEDSAFTVEQQRLLLLLWLLSMAFESMMPTRILTVAIGPGGSGKTSMFRQCGRVLIGPDFDVDSLQASDKGQENFWLNCQLSFLVAWDNVDQPIKWLADALAVIATGGRRTERVLHTNSVMQRSSVGCLLAVTARTPTYSLQREDVADRALIFTLAPREEKRAEYDLQEEVLRLRSELMSDYAHLVQRALAIPLARVRIGDPGMRMADFGRVITRIGYGLDQAEATDRAVRQMGAAQAKFATEENPLVYLLDLWLDGVQPRGDGSMDLGEVVNEGRRVQSQALWYELQSLARDHDIRWNVTNPASLGRQLQNIQAALSSRIEMDQWRDKKGKGWVFRRVGEVLDGDAKGCQECGSSAHVRTFEGHDLCPEHQPKN